MRKWKSWLGNGLLAAAAGLVGLFIAEGAVRVVAPRATATSHQDRYGLPMHYPGITRYLPRFGQEASFNSAGMRDREHTLDKPEGTFRILVLGDSFMEAYQVAFQESMPQLVEQALNLRTDRTVEVINAGVSGWGTDDELRYLTEYGLEYEPDLVLVAMTLHNDVSDNLRERWHTVRDGALVEQPNEPIPFLRYQTLRLKSFLAVRFQLVQIWREVRHRRESRESGVALLSHVHGLFVDPTPDPIAYGFQLTELLLEQLQHAASDHGAPVVLVLLPIRYQLSDEAFAEFLQRPSSEVGDAPMDKPQRLITESANRLGIPVIDLLPRFREWAAEHPEPLYIEWDGHWNQEGHRLAAETVTEDLIREDLIR